MQTHGTGSKDFSTRQLRILAAKGIFVADKQSAPCGARQYRVVAQHVPSVWTYLEVVAEAG